MFDMFSVFFIFKEINTISKDLNRIQLVNEKDSNFFFCKKITEFDSNYVEQCFIATTGSVINYGRRSYDSKPSSRFQLCVQNEERPLTH